MGIWGESFFSGSEQLWIHYDSSLQRMFEKLPKGEALRDVMGWAPVLAGHSSYTQGRKCRDLAGGSE